MPLTPEQRKNLLGHGGLVRIARRTRRTKGHVTEVNRERRRDAKVELAITRDIVSKHPEVSATDIWPATEPTPAQVA
jgi:hypothetical protein